MDSIVNTLSNSTLSAKRSSSRSVVGQLFGGKRSRSLYYDGHFDLDALRQARVTRWEVMAAAEQQGIADLNAVRVVELKGNTLIFTA